MPTITESLVERARPRKSKYELTCSTLRGFVLRVLPSGKKVYYVRLTRDGKDTRERIGVASELPLAEARRRAAERIHGEPTAAPRIERPTAPIATPRPSSSPLLRDFARQFIRDHVEPYLKPKTQRQYQDCIRLYLLPDLGAIPMAEITKAQVRAVHRKHRDTPTAANYSARVLSCMYGRAIDWGVLPDNAVNPAFRLRRYRETHRDRFLSPEERRRLERVLKAGLATPPGRPGSIRWSNVAAIRLLAWTGMRRQEVLDLTWEMVDYRHRCFRLPDSKTGRKVVPISKQVVALLQDLESYRKPGCPWVLYSGTNNKVHFNSLDYSWRLVRKRAQLEGFRLHDLRHSAASDALMSGVPLAVVGKVLGHKSPRTTARYAHIANHVLEDAVEKMGDAIERAEVGGRAKVARRGRSRRGR